MLNITNLSETQLYVESDRWQCNFGCGDPVRLGLVLEAVDLDEGGDEGFTYVIDACLIPQLDFLDEEILDEARLDGLEARGVLALRLRMLWRRACEHRCRAASQSLLWHVQLHGREQYSHRDSRNG